MSIVTRGYLYAWDSGQRIATHGYILQTAPVVAVRLLETSPGARLRETSLASRLTDTTTAARFEVTP